MRRNTKPSITTNGSTNSSSFSSSNTTSLAPQNMSVYPPQSVVFNNFPHHHNITSGQLGFPHQQPYLVPYDPNMMQFPMINVPHSFPPPLMNLPPLSPTGAYVMPSFELQRMSEKAEFRKRMIEIRKWKIARDKRRKQVRHRTQNSSHVTPNSTVAPKSTRVQSVPSGGSTCNIFTTPDGKVLEEILTKQLRSSDVGVLGRIVIPKREAEEKLPALCTSNKEGIEIVMRDIHSGIEWNFIYKYWINNAGRMYVIDGVGKFVNHYRLQMGDFLTLYEDKSKNLYVSTRKVERNLEESHGPLPNMGMYDANECLASLTRDVSHERKSSEAAAMNLECNGAAGGSSSSSGGTKKCNIMPNNSAAEEEVASNQLHHQFMAPIMNNAAEEEVASSNQAAQEEVAAAAAAAPLDDDETVYGGLEKLFEIENNYNIW